MLRMKRKYQRELSRRVAAFMLFCTSKVNAGARMFVLGGDTVNPEETGSYMCLHGVQIFQI